MMYLIWLSIIIELCGLSHEAILFISTLLICIINQLPTWMVLKKCMNHEQFMDPTRMEISGQFVYIGTKKGKEEL
jgi:hypothetical protein